MIYLIQLVPHTNVRYRLEQTELTLRELRCMLASLAPSYPDDHLLDASLSSVMLLGAPFLRLETSAALPEGILSPLSGLSSILMIFEEQSPLLRPVLGRLPLYLTEDLPDVLKYKGKTNVTFTELMINVGLSAAGLLEASRPLTVLDPLCGRGTTLFCALMRGMNSVGLDAQKSAIEDADAYLQRYFALHHFKHRRQDTSVTIPQGQKNRGQRCISYTAAADKEAFLQDDTRFLRLIPGDTALSGPLLSRKKDQVDLLVSDLPYGVQHAPKDGQGGNVMLESIEGMLRRALPQWLQALRKGGSCTLSFNTYTLRREKLVSLMSEAGFQVLGEPYEQFTHEVEQAVRRDVVTALKP